MTKTSSFDKHGLRKGAWNDDEDNKLRAYIQRYGHRNWRLLPKFAGLSRSGKSCRLRWMNYLRPNIKHGNFTKEDEDAVVELQKKLGNKWSEIASYLPGRSDNEIKNRWNTHLKKRAKKDREMLQNEHVRTVQPDQASTKLENPVQNSDLEFEQDIEILLTELPLFTSSTNLSSSSYSDFDLAGPSDYIPHEIADYTLTHNFWTNPFLPDNDSILSSGENLFVPGI